MIQGIVSLFMFVLVLAGIGIGTSWLIDNKAEVFGKEDGPSIAELPSSSVDVYKGMQSGQTNEDDGEEVEINKDSLEIVVLNGGDEVGAAGTFTEELEEAGYQKVSAGNASTYTYTNATLFYDSEDDVALARKLREELEDLFETKKFEMERAENEDQKTARITIILGEATE